MAKFRLPKRHALVATELHKNGLPKRIGTLCGTRGGEAAHNDAEVTCRKCALKIGKQSFSQHTELRGDQTVRLVGEAGGRA